MRERSDTSHAQRGRRVRADLHPASAAEESQQRSEFFVPMQVGYLSSKTLFSTRAIECEVKFKGFPRFAHPAKHALRSFSRA